VVKGSLLRRAVEEAEQIHAAEVIGADVSANPRIQRTLSNWAFAGGLCAGHGFPPTTLGCGA
jgi:hypothetical protein